MKSLMVKKYGFLFFFYKSFCLFVLITDLKISQSRSHRIFLFENICDVYILFYVFQEEGLLCHHSLLCPDNSFDVDLTFIYFWCLLFWASTVDTFLTKTS